MEIETTQKIEIELNHLLVQAHVRYWEDATVNGVEDEDGNLIPCRNGEMWEPVIDIETGVITNWEKGKEADIHYKVCDAGEYFLIDSNGKKVVKAKGYYVPDFLAINDDGFGDYIIMTVDINGKIKDWEFDIKPFEK